MYSTIALCSVYAIFVQYAVGTFPQGAIIETYCSQEGKGMLMRETESRGGNAIITTYSYGITRVNSTDVTNQI